MLRYSLLVILLWSGAASAQQTNATKAQVATIVKAVKKDARDPSSVQARNFVVTADKKLFCGEVNAKNAYGGFTGFRPTSGMLLSPSLAYVVAPPDQDEEVTLALCKQNGLRIPRN